MATNQEFCDALIEIYKNHGMYVGTANGEKVLDIAGKFYQMEKAYGRQSPNVDAARDYEFLAKCYRNGYDMTKAVAGDCSGIIIGILRAMGLIGPNDDYNAKTLQSKYSTPIEFEQLQPGDWVFDKAKDAGHIGTYIGDGMVIDSRGRDVGVVMQPISAYSWKAAGRPIFFEEIPPLRRNLKYIPDDMMKGDDVRMCQDQLQIKGFTEVGKADGVFGSKTELAVSHFQADNGLQVDGIVGPNTWAKLWE